MATRMDLHTELKNLFENYPKKVWLYYQPPSTIKMHYPCIVYNRDVDKVFSADNGYWSSTRKYVLTCVTDDPDSDMLDMIVRHFPMCRPSTSPYVMDNLYHFVASLYY